MRLKNYYLSKHFFYVIFCMCAVLLFFISVYTTWDEQIEKKKWCRKIVFCVCDVPFLSPFMTQRKIDIPVINNGLEQREWNCTVIHIEFFEHFSGLNRKLCTYNHTLDSLLLVFFSRCGAVYFLVFSTFSQSQKCACI